jgi:hypothetical protein
MFRNVRKRLAGYTATSQKTHLYMILSPDTHGLHRFTDLKGSDNSVLLTFWTLPLVVSVVCTYHPYLVSTPSKRIPRMYLKLGHECSLLLTKHLTIRH